MAPVPVGLLIPGLQSEKIVTFPMSLLRPHLIRPVLMIIPLMIIIMLGIVVSSIVLLVGPLVVPAVVLGLHCRRICQGAQEGRAAKAR